MILNLALYLGTMVQSFGTPGLASTCQTQSQPNPIVQQYPDQTTGTINGTVVVIPIPYSIARAAIPAQYPILIKQYQGWLPDLGQDMYPMMLNTLYDHDIQAPNTGINITDFSVRKPLDITTSTNKFSASSLSVSLCRPPERWVYCYGICFSCPDHQ